MSELSLPTVTPAEKAAAGYQGPEPILQFFSFAHLPPHMQAVSEPFCALANKLCADLPRNAERSVALRKLLEGKDAAVRAAIAK